MMKRLCLPVLWTLMTLALSAAGDPPRQVTIDGQTYALYPETMVSPPAISSPSRADDGTEVIVVCTTGRRYALAPVTVPDWDRQQVPYFKNSLLAVDRQDFPTLARTGLHSDAELARAKRINGLPVHSLCELAKPRRLSGSGFVASDEDLITVLRRDNRLVEKLGLTHPQLARPLLHLVNLILLEYQFTDGTWDYLPRVKGSFDHFIYHGRKVSYKVEFSKFGMRSLFADGVEGNALIQVRCEWEPGEQEQLARLYPRLSASKRGRLMELLSRMNTSQMEPFYIVRYGFYEGRTDWRTDPLAIAFMFGLHSLAEIEAAMPGKLPKTMTANCVKVQPAWMIW